MTKLCAPYFIHAVPYPIRIIVFVILSACGMLLIALTPAYTDGGTISTKLAGVVLASLSSGGGELSFLGLTHFYGPFSLAAWGSGTGGAGLIGAGAYAVATTSFGFSVKATLLASACLPAIMLLSFFVVLPREPLKRAEKKESEVEPLSTSLDSDPTNPPDPDDIESAEQEDERLLGGSADHRDKKPVSQKAKLVLKGFKANLRRSRSLFFPL
jgi:battenin